MTMDRRLLPPTDWTVTSLEVILDRSLEVGPHRTVEVTHLDTLDWRVFRAGATLSLETEGSLRTLNWDPEDQASSHALPVDREVRFAADLPEGFLKSTLEPILDVRALLTMGTRQVARRQLRVVDGEGSVLARLDLERSTVVDGSGAPVGKPTTVVRVVGVPEHESVFIELVERLRSAGACEVPADHELTAAAAGMGRTPGDYSSKLSIALDPDQRADSALRAILAQLLETVRANVDGVLADLDTEFLHDLRVATRRARAALAQTKGVLDRDATAALRKDLKWLGRVTNPCRDLDVSLLEMDGFREQLESAASHLDPLQQMLERDRREALGEVCRALRSARFPRLIDSWNALVYPPLASGTEPPDAARPIADVAGERILKAYRRMVERGSKLGEDPSPEVLHQLRIDGKKLRYLLEFFAGLYQPQTVKRLVKELKQLQDILGGFNDMTMQQAWLVRCADELQGSGDARAETLIEMERLAAAMTQRQEELYRGFAGAFAKFASPRSQERYRSLFRRRET
jgi:CHAD domain-containing protein